MPGIAFGRNKNVSFSVTAAIVDSTDLWLEEVSEDESKYKVDGEWRDLEKRTETFKISGKPDRDIVILTTHRGSLLDFDLLQFNSKLLFGEKVPDSDSSRKFSFGWTQATKGETAVGIIKKLGTVKSVKEALDYFDEIGKDGYNGLMGNLIFADNQGDIGYQLLAPLPLRKDKTPYIGQRVLDGTSSFYDWVPNKFVPISDLARAHNPEKGYLAIANSR